MADEARAMLDALMGADRNAPIEPADNEPSSSRGNDRGHASRGMGRRKRSCYDHDIDPLYTAWGVDVYDLFVNTKSDLGPNPFVPDSDAREEFLALPQREKDRLGYERELLRRLRDLVKQCDRTVNRNKEKLRAEIVSSRSRTSGTNRSDPILSINDAAVDRVAARKAALGLAEDEIQGLVVELETKVDDDRRKRRKATLAAESELELQGEAPKTKKHENGDDDSTARDEVGSSEKKPECPPLPLADEVAEGGDEKREKNGCSAGDKNGSGSFSNDIGNGSEHELESTTQAGEGTAEKHNRAPDISADAAPTNTHKDVVDAIAAPMNGEKEEDSSAGGSGKSCQGEGKQEVVSSDTLSVTDAALTKDMSGVATTPCENGHHGSGDDDQPELAETSLAMSATSGGHDEADPSTMATTAAIEEGDVNAHDTAEKIRLLDRILREVVERAEPLREDIKSQTRALYYFRGDTVTDKTVCEVSGNFMSSRDADERIAAHYAGKQYVGWKAVRDKCRELERKFAGGSGGGRSFGGSGPPVLMPHEREMYKRDMEMRKSGGGRGSGGDPHGRVGRDVSRGGSERWEHDRYQRGRGGGGGPPGYYDRGDQDRWGGRGGCWGGDSYGGSWGRHEDRYRGGEGRESSRRGGDHLDRRRGAREEGSRHRSRDRDRDRDRSRDHQHSRDRSRSGGRDTRREGSRSSRDRSTERSRERSRDRGDDRDRYNRR